MDTDSSSHSSSSPHEMSSSDPDGSRRVRTRWQHHNEGEEPVVLEPDHPLMKRFQTSLKAHLERQNTRITEEVLELDTSVKLKQKDREEFGNLLFTLQQEVVRQQSLLDEYNDSLAALVKMREEIEKLVQESKENHKNEMDKLNKSQEKESRLRVDLEKLELLERQLQTWADEMENDLTVSQRISEKTNLEKKLLAAEKRKQDARLYKLLNEVSNMDAKLVSMEAEFTGKECERNLLCQTIADANADLEALGKEQTRLLQSWKHVVVAMQQRDRHYDEVKKQLDEIQTGFQSICFETEALKRSTAAEQVRNEELTLVLNRVQTELAELERLVGIEEEKRDALEDQLTAAAAIIEQMDRDMAMVQAEIAQRQTEGRILQREVDKLAMEKVALEDEIMASLQEKMTNDMAATHMSKLAKQLREKTRQQELVMVESENSLTSAMLEKTRMEGENQGTELLLLELNKELLTHEREVDQLNVELKRVLTLASKRQGVIELLGKQLEKLVHKSGGSEMSPLELKMLNLEKTIQETVQKSDKLQQFWLRQEGHTVELAQQRNEQLNEINMIRKQVVILEQKNLKLEHEIDRTSAEEQQVTRSVASLMNQLVQCNMALSSTKGHQEMLDRGNSIAQSTYMNSLKEAELSCLQLESDLAEMEQAKQQLIEQLICKQREALAWDKKCQMAAETKANMAKECRPDGETGAMRAEIHRMHVRLSQLCRAQSKLVADLDHCVSRRDAIVDQAAARDKRSVKANNNRLHFQKTLEDLRNKTKQLNNKRTAVDIEMRKLEQKHEELHKQLTSAHRQVANARETVGAVVVQLEDAQLHKQQNLEQLVRRQRKVRQYSEIKQFRHRLLYKSEVMLDAEGNKQQTINVDLVSILEAMLGDFPDLRVSITKVLNTLRLQTS